MRGSVTLILTTYNRPTLVVDALESALDASLTRDSRIIIMDDGCNPPTRAAIAHTLASYEREPDDPRQPVIFHDTDRGLGIDMPPLLAAPALVWWQGRDRSLLERKARIPYSVTINIALNALLAPDSAYVCFLCDDDYLYPEGIEARAAFLDTHPEAEVCYGRMRSVEFDTGGFNKWNRQAPPTAGRAYPRPAGERVYTNNGASARTAFAAGEVDPQTGLDYVEEGAWRHDAPLWYGRPHQPDHNQVMLRRSALDDRFPPYRYQAGWREYWPEETSWGVGDAGFFARLGATIPFYPVDAWVVTKRYHSLSDGVSSAEIRE